MNRPTASDQAGARSAPRCPPRQPSACWAGPRSHAARRLPPILVWLLVGVVTVGGCGPASGRTGNGKLRVAVSILPQAWLVRQIGGEHVDVVAIVPPGASPATYQPSDFEMSRVMGSAVYFRQGVPFEWGPWFHAIQESQRLKIVDARGDIQLRDIEAHSHDDEGHGDPGLHCDDPAHADEHPASPAGADELGKDPHVWLSPRLLQRQAELMADALSEVDPEHAAEYKRNLAGLNRRLTEVDDRIRKRLAPYSGRAFFVFHPAWGYFADEYGLRQIPIEVHGKDPSDSELTELQEQARAAGARVVFVQPQVSGRAAAAVAAAIGGRVQQLDPLAEDVAAGLEAAAKALSESWQ